MENCIFCKIVAGKILATKVYEDDASLAFLDIKPHRKGHVLLIPKMHYRWVWDIPTLGPTYETARKIVHAQKKALQTDLVVSLVFGEEIHHAHIQLIPIENGGGKDVFAHHLSYVEGEMEAVAEKIRAGLKW